MIVLDFGSQYAQLIARRIRELHVYSELAPWSTPAESIMALNPLGFVLSGGPASIYEPDAPQIPGYVFDSGLPILGICYGMQALTAALGGEVGAAWEREYGPAEVETLIPNPLLSPDSQKVWMSHGDRIETPPPGFQVLGRSLNSPVAAIGDPARRYYGVQFHPEVRHTLGGKDLLRRFAIDICGAQPNWTPASIIQSSVAQVQAQVGKEAVISAVSGGVDSSVATAMAQQAVGDQLAAVFVDTGLLREGEAVQVKQALQENLGIELLVVEAADQFMQALKGVTDPEQKRLIIGELFIRIFEREARQMGKPRFLIQGTIYPDVVESSAPDRAQARRIKSHHNVGGLPEEMQFELVEPLRYLFKDEVREVGLALGLPANLVWRQPFPGPGLAVRCLGEITPQRLERLRAADAILVDELSAANLLQLDTETLESGSYGTSQAFAVLLPVRSVGVMGDQRTYQEAIALRAVTTEDFMTADWARLPYDLLARI
ncbi:MAG TPA: glutamine-hydrolyzing GMP synthase, partial [Anaerolineales bacterium]|nr:glutamine-hydrolyzing GMP synthase [Anaerolineales bacterium]